MARSSNLPVKCFLEHQVIKPAAVVIGLALVTIVGWVGTTHLTAVDARADALAAAQRPTLGIQVVQPDELVARMFSFPPGEAMLVNQVQPDSPAYRAGIRRGDGIVAINGRSIRSANDVDAMLTGAKGGDLLRVTVVRGGLVHKLLVTLGEQPAG